MGAGWEDGPGTFIPLSYFYLFSFDSLTDQKPVEKLIPSP